MNSGTFVGLSYWVGLSTIRFGNVYNKNNRYFQCCCYLTPESIKPTKSVGVVGRRAWLFNKIKTRLVNAESQVKPKNFFIFNARKIAIPFSKRSQNNQREQLNQPPSKR